MTGKTPLLSRGNIIGLARQAADPDKEDPLHNDLITLTLPELERFVAIVAERAAAAEREACIEDARTVGGAFSTEFEAFVAIRARGEA